MADGKWVTVQVRKWIDPISVSDEQPVIDIFDDSGNIIALVKETACGYGGLLISCKERFEDRDVTIASALYAVTGNIYEVGYTQCGWGF